MRPTVIPRVTCHILNKDMEMLEQSIQTADCPEASIDDMLVSSLIDVLGQELKMYRELKEFLAAEKKLLQEAPPLAQLQENNTRKENLILKTRILEEARSGILKKIARGMDIEEGALRLSAVANCTSPDKKRHLGLLIGDLAGVAREISVINDNNKYLLDTCILNSKVSIEFISSLTDRPGSYLPSGRIDQTAREGRLIRTEG